MKPYWLSLKIFGDKSVRIEGEQIWLRMWKISVDMLGFGMQGLWKIEFSTLLSEIEIVPIIYYSIISYLMTKILNFSRLLWFVWNVKYLQVLHFIVSIDRSGNIRFKFWLNNELAWYPSNQYVSITISCLRKKQEGLIYSCEEWKEFSLKFFH